jgi:hypothetical protein
MASKLTDLQIRNARPKLKPYKLAAGRGLTLVVMPDGAKYWRFRYRFAGGTGGALPTASFAQ